MKLCWMSPLFLAVILAGCDQPKVKTPQSEAMTEKEKRDRSRDKFIEFLKGKTVEEVVQHMGPPDHSFESDEFYFLTYNKRTVDPLTGKLDYSASIRFKHKKYDSVNFSAGN